jgi:hypothetical protein
MHTCTCNVSPGKTLKSSWLQERWSRQRGNSESSPRIQAISRPPGFAQNTTHAPPERSRSLPRPVQPSDYSELSLQHSPAAFTEAEAPHEPVTVQYRQYPERDALVSNGAWMDGPHLDATSTATAAAPAALPPAPWSHNCTSQRLRGVQVPTDPRVVPSESSGGHAGASNPLTSVLPFFSLLL